MTTRSVAFASYVDRAYLPGFEVLLKSLLLENPWVDHDFIVFYDDLDAEAIGRIALLYPKLVFRPIKTERYDAYVKGDESNYLVRKAYYILEAFDLRDYDLVITLDTDMVVIGDLGELLELDAPFAAVPQYFDSAGGRKLNSGLMVFDRRVMNDEFSARIDALGHSGEYELDRHDQGLLTAALEGDYLQLERRFNTVKRAVSGQTLIPSDVVILHYTGKVKPWNGGEVGYANVESHWHRYNSSVLRFWREYLALEGTPATVRAFIAELAAPYETVPTADDLELLGNGLLAERDYENARLAYELYLRSTDSPTSRSWLQYGIALRAVSRYDAARAALTVAAASPLHEHIAYVERSIIDWTVGDDEGAVQYATRAMRIMPHHRRAHLVLERVTHPPQDERRGEGPRILHAGFYPDTQGNYGDVMLPKAVRASLETELGPVDWTARHVHRVFDLEAAKRANAEQDAIVVGGGGLFLPDSGPNGNSNWQWNVTDEALDVLEIPLFVYTVGYNLFPGQEFRGTRFAESLEKLVRTAKYVGLRNTGSVGRVRDTLPASLADRIEFLPCQTTVYGSFDESITGYHPNPVERDPVVHLNIAFDRAAARFGGGYGPFVEQLAAFVRSMQGVAEVRLAAHDRTDERIAVDLRRSFGITVGVDSLYAMDPFAALDVYAASSAVLGMRGHAGMVPFGIGTPIVSLVSHAKLQYFLEDIGHVEWGVQVGDPELGDRLSALATDMVQRQDHYRAQVATARDALLKISRDADRRIAAEVSAGVSR